jgi:hypothetical protein
MILNLLPSAPPALYQQRKFNNTPIPVGFKNDEVVKNRKHSIPAYERATGGKKLVTVQGVGHTGIRSQKHQEAQQLALDWFDEHVKKLTPCRHLK